MSRERWPCGPLKIVPKHYQECHYFCYDWLGHTIRCQWNMTVQSRTSIENKIAINTWLGWRMSKQMKYKCINNERKINIYLLVHVVTWGVEAGERKTPGWTADGASEANPQVRQCVLIYVFARGAGKYRTWLRGISSREHQYLWIRSLAAWDHHAHGFDDVR